MPLAHVAPSPFSSWAFDPVQLVPLLVVGFLYFRRARTLSRRGQPVETWRLVSFGLGLYLIAFSLATPLGEFADTEFFWAHMLQHILIGDLAPLAMVAGLTGPLLRPVLSIRVAESLRVLAHPLVALPLWAVNLYLWHLRLFYEGALHHTGVHALEHFLFFTFGALMWAAVIEVLPGPRWFGTGAKLGYIVAVRVFETILGNVFIWSGHVLYPFFRHREVLWGISAKADQEIAGGLMMLEGSLVTIAAIAWLFLRMAREGELRQQLIEGGTDPVVAARAVRYGRGEELASGR